MPPLQLQQQQRQQQAEGLDKEVVPASSEPLPEQQPPVDVEPADNDGAPEEVERQRQSDQFRRHCRAFYRQATSVTSSSRHGGDATASSSSSVGGRSSDALGGSGTSGGGGGGGRSGSRVVVEALEHLCHVQHETSASASSNPVGSNHPSNADATTSSSNSALESYQSFLSTNAPHLTALSECGLANSSTFVADPAALERYVQIRTEERSAAHERHMEERFEALLGMLREMSETTPSEDSTAPPTSKGRVGNNTTNDTNSVIDGGGIGGRVHHRHPQLKQQYVITTRSDLKRYRSTMKRFVSRYRTSCVASHPFLAGLRRVLEVQLGSTGNNDGGSNNGRNSGSSSSSSKNGGGNASTSNRRGDRRSDDDEGNDAVGTAVRWTFDGAVLTEAIRTKVCGGGGNDAYVRDAINVLLCVMVWVVSPPPPRARAKGDDLKGDSGTNNDRGGGVDGGETTDEDVDETSKEEKKDDGEEDGETTDDEQQQPHDHLITFEVRPTLSDRTLRKVLEVLPRADELHCRPTGTVAVPTTTATSTETTTKEKKEEAVTNTDKTTGTVRTNVDGMWDEKDACHDFLENAFGGLRVAFCQR